MKTEIIAYFAGILDGEGSICIGSYTKTKGGKPLWSLSIQVSNTEEKMIDWLIENIGGKKYIYTRAQTPKNSRKTVYRWQILGHKMYEICLLVLPYSVIKKRQLEIMIAFSESLKNKDYRKGKRGPQVSDEVTAYRWDLFHEIRSLHNRLAAVKHI